MYCREEARPLPPRISGVFYGNEITHHTYSQLVIHGIFGES
jgi:hypothetical protein